MDRIVVNLANMNRTARVTADDFAPPRRISTRHAWVIGALALLIYGITVLLTP